MAAKEYVSVIKHPIAPFFSALYELPQSLSAPEVVLNLADGTIELDWNARRGVSLTVSIFENGRFAWAALIEGYKVHGSGWVDRFSDDFKDAAARYQMAEGEA